MLLGILLVVLLPLNHFVKVSKKVREVNSQRPTGAGTRASNPHGPQAFKLWVLLFRDPKED